MYTEVNKFKVKSGCEDELKALALDILESLKSLKGFLSGVNYRDKKKNEWGRTLVWETQEDSAVYSDSVLLSEHRERGRKLIDGPGEMKRYEVVGYVTAEKSWAR